MLPSQGQIEATCDWFVAAGQQPLKPEPNGAQAGFYVGMQLEELAEKLALIFGNDHPFVRAMEDMAGAFKCGTFDDKTEAAMRGLSDKMLDADLDLIWVSIGGARAQGADVAGAYRAVAGANWAKFPGGVANLDPVTRKVLKPAGWQEADLTPFIHETLR